MTGHCFVPPYLLRQIALSRPEDAAWVEQMLAHDDGAPAHARCADHGAVGGLGRGGGRGG